MKNNYIFDMDGTLYDFDNQPGLPFTESSFYADLKVRMADYIGNLLSLNRDQSVTALADISTKYNGEMSLGFEGEFGIDRYEYFAATWNADPERYVSRTPGLRTALQPVTGRATLLSAAPRVWIDRVLDYLEITDVYNCRIYSGEPDIRKPSPLIFSKILTEQSYEATNTVSVGDQNLSDILPAKALGLKTVLIGPTRLDADYRADDIYNALAILEQDGLL